MPRLKLDIPEQLPFRTEIPVRITDLNYANHLGNDRVLTLMHEARALYFLHLGFAELDAFGVGMVVADAAIVFKAEGFYPQLLIAEVGAGDFGKVNFDLYYRLIFQDTGKVMAMGKTGMVCYDFSAQKVKSVPPQLKMRLGDCWEVKS
ncbi:MAG: acyl-CoA thioesterase [Bacteroidia bacterium]|nr:acyl-CoA thioesterase [Bacteroidia bacterium]